ncbi:MAG: ATP-binding cassette domain-containing protein [Synergistaceae bacterium]|nr:ATP-binding cassette domain-containing protein [Synergistaceae bacterium]
MDCPDAVVSRGIISVKGLHKSYDGNAVLKGIDLDVKEGEVVSAIGPSGSGKSTLARCICRLEGIDSGSVSLCGVEISTGRSSSNPPPPSCFPTPSARGRGSSFSGCSPAMAKTSNQRGR